MASAALHNVTSHDAATRIPRKSAEIVRIRDLGKLRQDQIEPIRETMRATFPATSQHGMCALAAKFIPASPDTFSRIYEGRTTIHDTALLDAICYVHFMLTGKPAPLAVWRAKYGGVIV